MCLAQAKAVSIDGHPNPAYNGVYTHDSTHKGWPVLKNANGVYCYRHTLTDRWFLSPEFAPDKDGAFSFIATADGPLAVGAHTWWVWVDKEWQKRTLTVTLQ